MALNKVSSRIVDAVYARLSAPISGVNAGIIIQAPTYGLPPDLLNVNWTPQSKNFAFGQVTSDIMEKTGIFTYPFCCLYILETAQTGEQRFNQFSGAIRCLFEVFLSWRSIKGMQNYEAYPNCVEDVVFDVINRKENQNWGSPLVYNGNIQCRRGPLEMAAENFRQRLTFHMLFGLHQ